MLGRVRASPVDCSDLERPSPKITKNDALSIYEATLEKLRLGSRRALGSSSMKAMEIEVPSSSLLSASPSSSDLQSVDCSAMNMEVPCSSSLSASPGSGEVQSIDCSEKLMEQDFYSSLSVIKCMVGLDS
ncbi:uncharacterized protein LOC122656262 [Telopea speciosissima]|uniref:uncharacterized protein LOC122656262 n=1 Tax=Telopea speciosissima TaxID=54955 RepID=UPI001CC73F7F|nr:uncharacterized protein LOC122656262 [Telopea speciosissima]